jgi:pimeloyl-ACP methyl ester carboxylesterase
MSLFMIISRRRNSRRWLFLEKTDNLIPNRYLHGGPTRKVAESGTARMPAAQLKMIPKAGHFVMFEQAEAVNQLAADFLEVRKYLQTASPCISGVFRA